jgi:hypothetical protein
MSSDNKTPQNSKSGRREVFFIRREAHAFSGIGGTETDGIFTVNHLEENHYGFKLPALLPCVCALWVGE